jgi:subtilisin family serine protease
MEGSGLPVRFGTLAGLLGLVAVLVGLSVPAGAASRDDGVASTDTRIPGHYVVVLEDWIDRPGDVARAQTDEYDGRLGFVYRYALKGYSAELPPGAAQALRSDPRVKSVTPDREGKLGAQTNPTGVKRVFAIANTKLAINEKADVTIDADIAILDTGVEKEHPDLKVSGIVDCMSAPCTEGAGAPSGSHGTHVAGTAAAIDDANGVVGVAPGARIWSVKVSTATSATEAALIAGVDWVTSKASTIEVANMSIWCKCSLAMLEAAIKKTVEKGVVFVTIAGNDGEEAKNISPAKNPDAITVGAIADYDGAPGGKSTTPPCSLTDYEKEWEAEKDDTWANLSSWGPVVDIVAPGICIYSTVTGKGYGYNWGTSMAAPHVAGAAAILAAQSNPNSKADVEKIRNTILEQGNKEWTAEHEGEQQPLLDVSNESVFK